MYICLNYTLLIMKKIILLFLLLFSFWLRSDLRTFDLNMSPYSFSDNLLVTHKDLLQLQDKWFVKDDNNNYLKRIYRLGELFLIWDPINISTVTINHEFAGHGYRIRDIGKKTASVHSYGVSLPPPYGKGGGFTNFGYDNILTSQQLMSIFSAGTEASYVLSNKMITNWLKLQKIDGREATLYGYSSLDITNYTSILFALEKLPQYFGQDGFDGNDMFMYKDLLNKTYDYSKNLSTNKMYKYSMLNYLDPFAYYSLYSFLKYIWCGQDFEIPMIPIKKIRYLPRVRFGLTPFGPEFYLQNFFVLDEKSMIAYIRYGKFAENKYGGFGIDMPHLYSNKDGFILGSRVDLWYQPNIILSKGKNFNKDFQIYMGYDKKELKKKYFGAAFSLCFSKSFNKKPFNLFIEGGYKTRGFLPGFSLKDSPIIRFGFDAKY